MLKKILLALAIFFSSNLFADDSINVKECESNYSSCLEKCDTLDESKKEECYDKCDDNYSSCLDKVNAE